jgi:hypothetical protein
MRPGNIARTQIHSARNYRLNHARGMECLLHRERFFISNTKLIYDHGQRLRRFVHRR